MNAWLKQLVSLLLVLCLFTSGCAATRGHALASAGDGDLETLTVAGADHGPQPIGHRHAGKAATWVAVGFLLALVVTVDLLILPFTHHDPFPCCRGVLHICH